MPRALPLSVALLLLAAPLRSQQTAADIVSRYELGLVWRGWLVISTLPQPCSGSEPDQESRTGRLRAKSVVGAYFGDRNVIRLSPPIHPFPEPTMNEDAFNLSIRKFLKHFGVTAQREIERAVQRGLADGTLQGTETLPVRATLVLDGLVQDFHVDSEITLEGPEEVAH